MITDLVKWTGHFCKEYPGLLPGSLFVCLAIFITYRLVLSPLSKVPGPSITAITGLWIYYISWAERRNAYVHKLHKKYGPIVRLGPSEVSISDPAYLKDIYVGNFDKARFYNFSNFGQLNGFSMLDRASHAKRRKIMTQLYSKSNVGSPDTSDMIDKNVENTIQVLQDTANKGTSIDVFSLYQSLAMDTVTAFSVGSEFASNFVKNPAQRYPLDSWQVTHTEGWFHDSYTPDLAPWLTSKRVKENSAIIGTWFMNMVSKATDKTAPQGTVARKLFNAGLKPIEVYSELMDHVAAGHETTGITLSYLSYHLSLHPEIQEKLFLEIQSNFGTPLPSQLPPSEVDNLVYLDGVIRETLRLYTAIPASEPRIVPSDGFIFRGSEYYKDRNETDNNNMYLPPGTIVSMQPFTLHRDDKIFNDPLKFIPERWYKSDKQQLSKMNKSFMAFGHGMRMCLGNNLAMQEMKQAILQIYGRFTTSIDEGYNHDFMIPYDRYTIAPKGYRLDLKFHSRK